MTKRQLIDRIVEINRSASPEFLASFQDDELGKYLDHLQVVGTPRLTGNGRRYERYFRGHASSLVPGRDAQPQQVVEPAAPADEAQFEPVVRQAGSEPEPALAAAAQEDPKTDSPFAVSTQGSSTLLF